MFIESAVQQYSSCLIVSVQNKTNTIVVVLIYLMMKYKWNMHRSLEYVSGKKGDIEITKNILKQLHVLEHLILKNLRRKSAHAILRSSWILSEKLAERDYCDFAHKENHQDDSRLHFQEIFVHKVTKDASQSLMIPNLYLKDTYI